jgi:hypothetical protein
VIISGEALIDSALASRAARRDDALAELIAVAKPILFEPGLPAAPSGRAQANDTNSLLFASCWPQT